MNDVTFDILKIVISVCVAIFTAYIIPYLKTLRNDARYKQMIDLISVAVRAAEQTIKESGSGALKKEKVILLVTEWLTKQGIPFTEAQLEELIESAVWQMKQEQR